MIPARFHVTADTRRIYGDQLDRLAPFLTQSDLLADAVVASFAEFPKGAGFRLLEVALARGIDAVPDAPEPLRALFAAVDRVPVWLDWDAVERGGAVFMRSGALGATVLGVKSLVTAYASPGGNKPLIMSGQLQGRARRRLGETGRFVHAVSQPGGMRRFSDGFAICVKVRVMHAQVRRLVLASGRWREELWGVPVNQHDMVSTILLFSSVLLEGLSRLGYRVTPTEAESLVHLWRYVGLVIGVDPELLPGSLAEANRIAQMIYATQGPPDDDSRSLVNALLTHRARESRNADERREAERLMPISNGLCRAVIDEDLADQLGVLRSPLEPGLPALRALLTAMAPARSLAPMRYLANALSKRYWERTLAFGLVEGPAEFKPPERIEGIAARAAG
jgi:ER-bound oxygenase mpaB/B'/Rubber oxygenase, catalytic domain